MKEFVDCHVHLALDGINFNESVANWDNQEKMNELLIERLKQTRASGIVAVRDGGDIKGLGLLAKKLAEESEEALPQVVATGPAFRRDSLYGSFLGEGLVWDESSHEGFKREVQSRLRKLKSQGVSQVKVIISGIVSFSSFGKVGKIQFSSHELRTFCQLACDEGLKVMAHVNSPEGIDLAIAARVHSIEHGYFIEENQLEQLAKENIYWVPTVVPVANQIKKLKENYSREDRQVITKTFKRHLTMVKKAVEVGVKVGVGTDAGAVGVEHGKDYFRELELFREAGLDNSTIIKAATVWGREIIT